MITIILIIHIFLALSIIIAVLLQKSEGGGLGIGGSFGEGALFNKFVNSKSINKNYCNFRGMFFYYFNTTCFVIFI